MPRQIDDKPSPPTVGFNLKEMRERATQTMIDAIRQFARELDKIDTLDEMFNKQHQAAVAQVSQQTGAPETRTNGHRAVKTQPTKEQKALLDQAILEEITRAPGSTQIQLTRALLARGDVLREAEPSIAAKRVAYRLRKLGKRLRVERVGTSPTSPQVYYYPASYYPDTDNSKQPKRKPFSKKGLAAVQQNIAKAQAARWKAKAKTSKPVTKTALPPVRELTLGALTKLRTATPMEISDYLIKQGVPPKRGRNDLNMHVNWALRGMFRQHQVVKHPNPANPRSTRYSLASRHATVKPATESEPEEARVGRAPIGDEPDQNTQAEA